MFLINNWYNAINCKYVADKHVTVVNEIASIYIQWGLATQIYILVIPCGDGTSIRISRIYAFLGYNTCVRIIADFVFCCASVRIWYIGAKHCGVCVSVYSCPGVLRYRVLVFSAIQYTKFIYIVQKNNLQECLEHSQRNLCCVHGALALDILHYCADTKIAHTDNAVAPVKPRWTPSVQNTVQFDEKVMGANGPRSIRNVYAFCGY